MKYITLLIIFLNMFASVAAKDLHNKILHLPQDGSFIDAVPFKIESINVSRKNIVRIEKKNDKLIRIIALQEGFAKVTINGIEKKQNYTVIVADWEKKVRLKLRNLGGELEKFPEINTEFQRKKGKIILRGEFLLSASFEEKNKLVKKYEAILKEHNLFIEDKTTCNYELGKKLKKRGLLKADKTIYSSPKDK